MDRRSFLRGLGLLVGGVVAAEAIPLGRVWSFPNQIVIADPLCNPYRFYIEMAAWHQERARLLRDNFLIGIPYQQVSASSDTYLGLDRREVLGA